MRAAFLPRRRARDLGVALLLYLVGAALYLGALALVNAMSGGC